MSTKRTFFYTMLAAGLLASCTNDELADNPLADGPVALSVTADISQVVTRATATAFENEDPIGIFPIKDTGTLDAEQANRLYTYNGSTFTGTKPYYFQDRGWVTFNAYYPYDADLTATAHTIDINTRAQYQKIETIEGTAIAWRTNDYLFASAMTNVIEPSVSYTDDNAFNHVMTQVVFVFNAGTDDGVSDLSALGGYKIATPLVMDGSFDAATGEVTLDADAKAEEIAMTVTGPAATELRADPLILLPQAISGSKLELEVTYNDQTYKAALNAPTADLQAGYSYTYTVTIKNTELEVTNASINAWHSDQYTHSQGDATLQ